MPRMFSLREMIAVLFATEAGPDGLPQGATTKVSLGAILVGRLVGGVGATATRSLGFGAFWLTLDSTLASSTLYWLGLPAEVAPGDYKLYVAMLDAAKQRPPIHFAIDTPQQDGWYALGTIAVKPPVPTPLPSAPPSTP